MNNVLPGLHLNLPPLDPKSDEFTDTFRSSLLPADERQRILELSDEDAKAFIEIIDKAFQAARLEPELQNIAFAVLRRLCGKTGYLPDSYLLSEKFDLSEMPRAFGGFADIRIGMFKGKDVAIKTLRVSEVDEKITIRKRFCEEVAVWKNLSHPNILGLIGVPDTLDDGRLSMVSEWMGNGNIVEYVCRNAGNHLRLLGDAVEGLKYLHGINIVHGDLKGANILITRTTPISTRLADFGSTVVVLDPEIGMETSESARGEGSIPFMAPELLAPSKFGLDERMVTKEADIYAMAMVIYQVLTGTLPLGDQFGPQLIFEVLNGTRPSKPVDAQGLGFSDEVWELLEDCWETGRELRPPVEEVLSRISLAASICSTLPPVGNATQRHRDPGSDYSKFDVLFFGTTAVEDKDTPLETESASSQETDSDIFFDTLSAPVPEFDPGPYLIQDIEHPHGSPLHFADRST